MLCYVMLCYVKLSQVNPCRTVASNAMVLKNTGFVWWDVGHAMRHAATRPAGMLHHTHMPTHIVQCAGHSHTRTAACTRGRRRHARASLRACERAPSTRQQQQHAITFSKMKNLHPRSRTAPDVVEKVDRAARARRDVPATARPRRLARRRVRRSSRRARSRSP